MPAETVFDFSLACDFVAPSRTVFGWGRRDQAGVLARSLGRRAFVVCGSRTLARNGAWTALLAALADAGVEAVDLGTISREPLVADVDATVARLRQWNAGAGDLMLALGGGSAIDLAKAAGALVTNRPGATVRDYLEGVGSGFKIVEPPLPLLAIPTTGGTGTEGTKNAVISSLDPPFKKSLRSELMVPRIVLIDPELSVELPPQITAWTGMDAITQLIESFLSRRATPATQRVACLGLRGAIAALHEAFFDGRSRPAREKMAEAAFLSGVALANSGLGMAHGVAAALGVHCNVAHGLACAVMLPAALRFNLEIPEVHQRFSLAARAILGESHEESAGEPAELVSAALAKIDSLARDVQIPRRLSEIGVRRAQIPELVRDSRGNSMSGNPREVSDENLTAILEAMY
jgi:alcohol dehydrogenase class IV